MTFYEFEGRLETGRAKRSFKREVEAESEKHAKDQLYSVLGSEQSVTRSKITVETVTQQQEE